MNAQPPSRGRRLLVVGVFFAMVDCHDFDGFGSLTLVGGNGGGGAGGVALLDDGVACNDALQCASGFCADGVCCDEACDGPCLQCSESLGSCEPSAPSTTDDACAGICSVEGACLSDGEVVCVAFIAGSGNENAPGLAIDDAGGVAVTGEAFNDTVFVTADGDNDATPSFLSVDSYLLHLDPSCNFVDVHRFAGNGAQRGRRVARTGNGHLIAGVNDGSTNTATVDLIQSSHTALSSHEDAFVGFIDDNGSSNSANCALSFPTNCGRYLGQTQLPLSTRTTSIHQVTALAHHPSRGWAMSFNVDGEYDDGAINRTSNGVDGIVVRGPQLGFVEVTGDGDQTIAGLAWTPDGEFAIAGTYENASAVAGQPLAWATGQRENLYVAGTVSAGTDFWAVSLGTDTREIATGVASTPEGDFIVIGRYFDGVFDVGLGGLPRADHPQGEHFILKVASSGNLLFNDGVVGAANLSAIAVDDAGNIFVAGNHNRPLSHSRDPAVVYDGTANGMDAFVMKLTSSGDPMWVRHLRGEMSEFIQSLAAAPNGMVVASGRYSGDMDIDDVTLRTVTAAEDGFVVFMAP